MKFSLMLILCRKTILYQVHGVVNRTKPNQKSVELNHTHRSDYCTIDSVIEHNRTELIELPNSIEPIDAIRSLLLGRKTKRYKTREHLVSIETERFSSQRESRDKT